MKLKISLKYILYFAVVLYVNQISAQNLIDTSVWTEGNNQVSGFSNYGSVNENSREYHNGPGASLYPLVWKATPIVGNYANGGWTTSHKSIDSKETYRFTLWMKKTGSNGGRSYFGTYGNKILNLNGDEMPNPYFWYGSLPQLDKWYLIVGYVHGSKYDSKENYGGIYDENGVKVKSIRDFKFSEGATWARPRNYLVKTPNAIDRQYYYAPRLEQVNGEEPTIEDLIGLNFDYDCNLIDDSTWRPGSEVLEGFSNNGPVSENSREWGKNHIGEDVILWKATPGTDGHASGGWNSRYYDIGSAGSYRFSVWLKKTNSNNGNSYLGCRSPNNILRLDGTTDNNPYFWVGDLPKLNRWYLVVGYVHNYNYNSTANLGRIYDGVTGKEVKTIKDFKFKSTATKVLHRSYLYYDSNTEDRQYFYEPRIDKLSGCEPSINELLRINEDSSLIFSFDNAGNQMQRFYCHDSETCSPIAARKADVEEYTSEEDITEEEKEDLDITTQLKIYPNPTSGKATLQIQDELLPEIEFIKIYTVNSVLINSLELNTSKNKLEVDLSNKPSGIYFVHVHLKDGSSITKKIIKK